MTITEIIKHLQAGNPDFHIVIEGRDSDNKPIRFEPYSVRWESGAVVIDADYRTTKVCRICREDLPRSEFGLDKSRRDKKNPDCKNCVREKMAERRWEMKNARRKDCRPVFPVWRMKLKPRDAALMAIKRGASTQAMIQRATRLHEDALTDAIADLYAENKLDRSSLKERRYRIAA